MMKSISMSESAAHLPFKPGGCNKRVLLMETCPMTQAGICRLLTQPYYQIKDCLLVPKASDLLLMAERHRPSLVIMALVSEGGSILGGLRLINKFLATWPCTPLMVCTALLDSRLLQQLVSMGVQGIYHKQDSLLALAHCLKKVMQGQHSVSPRAGALIGSHQDTPVLLTYREIDVLECLFKGKSVTGAAVALQRDIRTVSTHKRNVMNKLGFRNDCELYTWGAWLSHRSITA